MADVAPEAQLSPADLTPVEPSEQAPVGDVHKVFRHYDPHQQFLIPPSLDDWLDEGHLARFVSDLVDEALDLGLFFYCYRVQTVVDEAHQVVVATSLSNRVADCPELPAMLDQVIVNTKAVPKALLADAGYFSGDNVEETTARGVDPFIATGRLRHNEEPPPAPRGRIPKGLTPKARTARKLRIKTGRAAYPRRKAIVEPVFDQVDTCHGGKALLLRGLEAAEAEWHLIIACHNFRKWCVGGDMISRMRISRPRTRCRPLVEAPQRRDRCRSPGTIHLVTVTDSRSSRRIARCRAGRATRRPCES